MCWSIWSLLQNSETMIGRTCNGTCCACESVITRSPRWSCYSKDCVSKIAQGYKTASYILSWHRRVMINHTSDSQELPNKILTISWVVMSCVALFASWSWCWEVQKWSSHRFLCSSIRLHWFVKIVRALASVTTKMTIITVVALSFNDLCSLLNAMSLGHLTRHNSGDTTQELSFNHLHVCSGNSRSDLAAF